MMQVERFPGNGLAPAGLDPGVGYGRRFTLLNGT